MRLNIGPMHPQARGPRDMKVKRFRGMQSLTPGHAGPMADSNRDQAVSVSGGRLNEALTSPDQIDGDPLAGVLHGERNIFLDTTFDGQPTGMDPAHQQYYSRLRQKAGRYLLNRFGK